MVNEIMAEGARAQEFGLLYEDCPYHSGEEKHLWQAGYVEAEGYAWYCSASQKEIDSWKEV